ncbi:hypothetical protein [Longimicrobium terrae]|uniref:Uncharacterized protein n=1 Tax=Longimicrobium terrae TaxID=1639882 RepID=A0A841GZF3_9BACT|nr:hypothetical protein [Longimicrobium terrae]MBB4636417.1 hypothetical protein [Longimicrobium terrae]MBB6071059.1 hypothetical protein [Longimicrobium terrae]NNC29080.1 hypothetical protein [Longimicrobium terrae]
MKKLKLDDIKVSTFGTTQRAAGPIGTVAAHDALLPSGSPSCPDITCEGITCALIIC